MHFSVCIQSASLCLTVCGTVRCLRSTMFMVVWQRVNEFSGVHMFTCVVAYMFVWQHEYVAAIMCLIFA